MRIVTCMWRRNTPDRCHNEAKWYVPWKGDRFFYCNDHIDEVEKSAKNLDPETKFVKEAV